jgi:hypothetical protein
MKEEEKWALESRSIAIVQACNPGHSSVEKLVVVYRMLCIGVLPIGE